MRLATLKIERPRTPSEAKDGALLVVSADGKRGARVPAKMAPNLLDAMERWDEVEPKLRVLETELGKGRAKDVVVIEPARLLAPLPRTWAWLDGSAFIQHIILVRKARGAEPPEDLFTVPLMYQGVSDNLLGPCDDIPLRDEAFGMDFEAEVAVILDAVPMGTEAKDAARHVKLLMLMNDVSLRNLIPRELAAGFGFFQGKPASSFSPFVATPDELGDAWRDGRLRLDLEVRWNGRPFGRPNAGEMHFSFFDLIEHAARTRELSPGTILGSGTVSNKDESRGCGCIAERRMIEKIKTGSSSTPFMKPGDSVEIEMLLDGRSVFGAVRQKVVPA